MVLKNIHSPPDAATAVLATTSPTRGVNVGLTPTSPTICALCKRPFERNSSLAFVDRNYFRLLQEAYQRYRRSGTRPSGPEPFRIH